jgi:uncharacterized membrane protein affecting hemolysin expression
VDIVTAIIDLARESICAVLTLVVLAMLYHQDRRSGKQRGEIERMVREILRSQNGRHE